MRLCRLFVVLLAALALAGCGTYPKRQAGAVPQGYSELDTIAYGHPGAVVRPPAGKAAARLAYRPQPSPAYPAPMPQAGPAAVPADDAAFALDGTYTLDAGDKLRVVVFGQDQLSNTYQVDPHGQIAMPLIGTVTARGLTTAQLSGTIAAKLRVSFMRDPSVAVEVETYRPFFILGEVTYPGQYPFVAKMTVESAAAIAGGFTPRAGKSKVTVTRQVQGRPLRFALPLNHPLRPGDIVTVGERWF